LNGVIEEGEVAGEINLIIAFLYVFQNSSVFLFALL